MDYFNVNRSSGKWLLLAIDSYPFSTNINDTSLAARTRMCYWVEQTKPVCLHIHAPVISLNQQKTLNMTRRASGNEGPKVSQHKKMLLSLLCLRKKRYWKKGFDVCLWVLLSDPGQAPTKNSITYYKCLNLEERQPTNIFHDRQLQVGSAEKRT